jgi:hypothetical protein
MKKVIVRAEIIVPLEVVWGHQMIKVGISSRWSRILVYALATTPEALLIN